MSVAVPGRYDTEQERHRTHIKRAEKLVPAQTEQALLLLARGIRHEILTCCLAPERARSGKPSSANPAHGPLFVSRRWWSLMAADGSAVQSCASCHRMRTSMTTVSQILILLCAVLLGRKALLCRVWSSQRTEVGELRALLLCRATDPPDSSNKKRINESKAPACICALLLSALGQQSTHTHGCWHISHRSVRPASA
jgi:hypothetical protein